MTRLSSRLLSILLPLLAAATIYAQGTDLSTIRGTVMDVSGGVIPKAAVVITDLETNISHKLSTDGEGNYEASGLKYGT